ncbi:aldehyde dehydrogenase family protein [Paraburkholderia youngii]|uniref:aldehyde dehydrogenase family protein n=1 Tax=Paraburkholderia youngii TaxID=2782701 RepID=UPI003D18FFEA
MVYPDAATPEYIYATVTAIINAMRFARQGQSYTAGSRLSVQKDVWDAVMTRLVTKVKEAKGKFFR